jgi:DNA-binding MarR family transcriptional regulator
MGDQTRTDELNQALELLHFGYRKVIERPDALLEEHGLSRVHHRVLYFLGRNPGVSVGELLTILDVSKQALNKPLRELVQGGWIETSSPPGNRRVKQLRLSERGAALEEALSGDQRRRFARVFTAVGREAEVSWREVMRRLARM